MGNDNIFKFILLLGFAVVFPIGMYHRLIVEPRSVMPQNSLESAPVDRTAGQACSSQSVCAVCRIFLATFSLPGVMTGDEVTESDP